MADDALHWALEPREVYEGLCSFARKALRRMIRRSVVRPTQLLLRRTQLGAEADLGLADAAELRLRL